MFHQRTHWHTPDKYKSDNPYTPELIAVWVSMPILFVVLMIFVLISQMDIRQFYSEVYVTNTSISSDGKVIALEFNDGSSQKSDTLGYEISSLDNNIIMINVCESNKNPDCLTFPENFVITVPVNESIDFICIQQKNGLKQLLFEKEDATKWKMATEWSRLIFFAQEHPTGFVIFTTSSIGLIAIVIILICLIIKIRRRKNKKDYFIDPL